MVRAPRASWCFFKKKPRLAIFNQTDWSIGRIHSEVVNHLSDDYDFTIFDWNNTNDVQSFNNTWKEYDAILSNGVISNYINDPAFHKKCICVCWAEPKLEGNHFIEVIGESKDILWAAPTGEIAIALKRHFNIDAEFAIAGVNSEHFYPTRKINKIRTLGLNGIPFINKGWDLVKRPQMFVDICKEVRCSPEFINNRDLNEHHNLYKDIDMYVCTSTHEAGPYGIAEAAFCKIPVISTPVGFASRFKSIKTFNTVDEAVKIINELNSDPVKLEKYVNDVYDELTEKLDWNYAIQRYWKPLIEKRLNLNKS